MKARMNIRSIIMIMATICLASMFFINICFAANTGKITTETARLREQPQTDAKVLELASLGDEVEIIEEVDGWYKVKYKNITGYVRTDLIEVDSKKDNKTNTVEFNNETKTENVQVDNTSTEIKNTSSEDIELKKGKYKLLENTKLKIIPLISSIELDEVNKDVEVEITEILNDWAKIKTAEGKEGWVLRKRTSSTGEIVVLFGILEGAETTTKSESSVDTNTTGNNQNSENKTETKVDNKTKIMYVNSQTTNLRQKADKTSQIIKQLSINTQVTVLSTDNGWAYVDVNGTKGYIAETLLSSSKQETSRGTMTERDSTDVKTETKAQTELSNTDTPKETTSSQTGNSIISYAKQFLGCKYVYGGTTTSGFDCSGFTQYVYKHFGVTLNRTAAAQYSNGTSVTNLQAGDLLMFGKSGINHVGIYIGGNTFIHAANPSRGVTIDTLASGYYKTNYVGARRILN